VRDSVAFLVFLADAFGTEELGRVAGAAWC
jgi:hypothetical protein